MSKVPVGWGLTNLGAVITYQKGYAFNSSSYKGFGIRIIRISDTTKSGIHSNNPVYISAEDTEGLCGYSIYGGDVILSTVGSRPHLIESRVGKAVQIPSDIGPCLLNQNLVKISPVNNAIENNYLFEIVKNDRFITYISTLVRGNANQVSITLADIFKYSFLLPPLPEQTKIAQILSTWDKTISTTEKLIGNSQQQKKALMQSLLTGKKRLPGFEGEFRDCKFADVAKIDRKNLNNKTLNDFTFKYISLSDVKSGYISESLETYTFKDAPSRARRIIQKGDVLLATVRPNLQGFARVRKKHSEMIASTGFSVISSLEGFSNDYIYHYLYSDSITSQIDSLVVGSNYPAINSSDVANLQILCPEYNEQLKIADILNNCDDLIEFYQKKLSFLKQEKTALMQQLLTGKRRVKINATEECRDA